MSLLLPYIKQKKRFIKKIIILYASLSRFVFYPDPDKRFLKWIRIRNPVGYKSIKRTDK